MQVGYSSLLLPLCGGCFNTHIKGHKSIHVMLRTEKHHRTHQHETDLPALNGLIRYLYSPSPIPAVVTCNLRGLGSCCKPSKLLFKVELILHLLEIRSGKIHLNFLTIIASFLLTLGSNSLTLGRE